MFCLKYFVNATALQQDLFKAIQTRKVRIAERRERVTLV